MEIIIKIDIEIFASKHAMIKIVNLNVHLVCNMMQCVF